MEKNNKAKMQASFRLLKKMGMSAFLYSFRIFGVRRNRVVLINSLAKTYSDNIKYVGDELLSKYGNDLEIIVALGSLDDSEALLEKGFKVTKFNSLKYFFYVMTCQAFVTTATGFSYIPIRKSQYVINTWHGGGAYKKAGLDMFKNASIYKHDLKMSADKTAIFVSSSKKFSDVMAKSMMIPRDKFWEIGLARNDVLLNPSQSRIEEIKKSIGVDTETKIVLYCPTYRKPKDNYFNESVAITYGLDPDRVCEALVKRFGGKWKFAYRMHPNIKEENDEFKNRGINLTKYPDMQDLLLVADVMINDFSSSMWDYMLTGKPCFLYATDMDHYIATTELYTPMNELPYPQARSNEELVNCIENFDEKEYKRRCDQNYNDFGGCETGEASQLIAKRIYDICTK